MSPTQVAYLFELLERIAEALDKLNARLAAPPPAPPEAKPAPKRKRA